MLNQYKQVTRDICHAKGWDKSPIGNVWLLFTEEVGELASAIRQHNALFKKRNLKKTNGTDIRSEMGDVFSYLFQLAYMMEVDLDKMWQEHQDKVKTKNYNNQYTINETV